MKSLVLNDNLNNLLRDHGIKGMEAEKRAFDSDFEVLLVLDSTDIIMTFIILNSNTVITSNLFESSTCMNELSADSKLYDNKMKYWDIDYGAANTEKVQKEVKFIYKNEHKMKRVSFTTFEGKVLSSFYNEAIHFDKNWKRNNKIIFQNTKDLLQFANIALLNNSVFDEERFELSRNKEIKYADDCFKINHDTTEKYNAMINEKQPTEVQELIDAIAEHYRDLTMEVIYDLDQLKNPNLKSLYYILLQNSLIRKNFVNHKTIIRTLLSIDALNIMEVEFHIYARDMVLKKCYKLDSFLLRACYYYFILKKEVDFDEAMALIFIILGYSHEFLVLYEGKDFGKTLSNKLADTMIKISSDKKERLIELIEYFSSSNKNVLVKAIEYTQQEENFREEFMSIKAFELSKNRNVEKVYPKELDELGIKVGEIKYSSIWIYGSK